MISKESYGFNTFAANRIGEIQHQTDKSEWYWLSGKLNIADCITRGKSPKDLGTDSIQQQGPECLSTHEKYWPISLEHAIDALPERPKQIFHTNSRNTCWSYRYYKIRNTEISFKLHSTLSNVIPHDFAIVVEIKTKDIQVSDVEKAEKLWIVAAQTE